MADKGTDQARLNREDEEERQLIRPPDVNRDTNRSATRLELFFDLAFVLFVGRCADVLAHHETWSGGFQFVALLVAGWWGWASTTLYANRFDTDDAIFRLLTLIGMAGVIVMAASAEEAIGPHARWFAIGYVLLRIVLILGYLRVWRNLPDTRVGIRPYLWGHCAGAACWLASLAVPGTARYVLWAAGVLVDLLGPTLAARVKDAPPLHMEHLPERFGLFVILVLGESVTATVTGIQDGKWSAGVLVAAAFAFLATAALWWSYFDLSGGAAKRRLIQEGGEHTRQGVHDFYVYAHLPVAVSLAAVAVGLEHAIAHGADDHLSTGTRVVLGAGLAGYLLSATVIQGVLSGRWRVALLWPGLGVPLILLITLLFDGSPAALTGLCAAVLVAGVITGVRQHRAGEVRVAKV
ncbi:low temperature requirement protein A [Actinoplanes teichomyceticus]|uniref:Low temperature requirement protein LtrA n=1 Tax=Actinoplanes teichomyceticus TaxID=1867 RepID=A0A561WJY2_ACTTI|nr:low temperature requirement protein A [Actinoplanes teichomyceticus]TWG24181.1 low temperature requirement protein LtrA [Actinoplanes teichomyceticus]GIF12972.1 low temperature requirement protein A [Actinoplanes teichomyceticus]